MSVNVSKKTCLKKRGMPHLLELFAGTGSIGRVFRNHGWTVTSVDLEPKFEPTICCNVLDVTPEMIETRPDLIWASPPCTHYSRARTTAKTPRDLEGSDKLVQKVLDLVNHYGAPFFMENPAGLLLNREVVRGSQCALSTTANTTTGTTRTRRGNARTQLWPYQPFAWGPPYGKCNHRQPMQHRATK